MDNGDSDNEGHNDCFISFLSNLINSDIAEHNAIGIIVSLLLILFITTEWHCSITNELMLLLKADDSVSITNGYKSGFYLNTIQKNFNNKIDFTNALLEKANLSIDYDFDNLEVNTYKTIEGRKFKLKEYMEIQNEA
jgi:hypothetical protein